MKTFAFADILLKWHVITKQRNVPWYNERNPYKIWLREIILQQTQVQQGLQYYLKFVKNYPTIQALASESLEAVLKLWEGLGYYNRCKNLHKTAQQIVNEFNGKFPENYSQLMTLKGIGPYTAAAIASFAYNLPYSVIDGNVKRVLARIYGVQSNLETSQGKKSIDAILKKIFDATHSPQFNQAIMDFGAIQCKPQQPNCNICCFAPHCFAFKNKKIVELPVKKIKLPLQKRYFTYFILHFNNKILIKQRDDKDIWSGLHDYFLIEDIENQNINELEAQNLLKAKIKKIKIKNIHLLNAVSSQKLSHQHLFFKIFLVHLKDNIFPCNTYFWEDINTINNLAFPIKIKPSLWFK